LGSVPDLTTSVHSIPNGHNLWSILGNHAPTIITDRFDTSLLNTGRAALISTLGASWTQTEYRLNGFNVTDPYTTGLPLLNFDRVSFEVESGAGATLNLKSRAPGRDFHGGAAGFGSHHKLQSDNMDARLRNFNFAGPEAVRHYVDGSGNLGGTLRIKDFILPAFVSLSTQHLSKDLGGFPSPIDASVNYLLSRFSPLQTSSHTLNVLYAYQKVFLSHEEADPRIAPEATTRARQTFQQFQTSWLDTVNSTSLIEAHFGIAHGKRSSKIQDEAADSVSAIELPLLMRTDAAPFSTSGSRTRYEARAMYSKTSNLLRLLRLGGEFSRNPITNRWQTPNPLQRIFIHDQASELVLRTAPAQAQQHTQSLALFAQSRWQLFKRLELNASARYEDLSGVASGADNRISWRSVYPRAVFALPLQVLGSEEMVLRGGWSRYGYALPGNYLDFGNPAALSEQVFRWTDGNRDRQIQAQERGALLRRSGGAYSAIDAHLRRPYVDEIFLGIEQHFGRHLFARAKFFRRDDSRLINLVNTGVPLSSYTERQVTDPGNDGIFGNSDDQLLTLFDRQPAALGKDFLLLTNTRRASYKGFQVELIKPLSKQFAIAASFSAMRSLAATNVGNGVFENDIGVIGSLGTDPNTYRFANSRTFFDRAYTGQLTGEWTAPKGIRIGVIARYYDGLPFGRLLFVEDFNQGGFFVRATNRAQPGAFRTQFNSTTDLRVTREFQLSNSRMALIAEVFNLLNQNQNTVEESLTGPTFEQRVPLSIQPPRLIRLGVSWNF
jgi:hypothetical protein